MTTELSANNILSAARRFDAARVASLHHPDRGCIERAYRENTGKQGRKGARREPAFRPATAVQPPTHEGGRRFGVIHALAGVSARPQRTNCR